MAGSQCGYHVTYCLVKCEVVECCSITGVPEKSAFSFSRVEA